MTDASQPEAELCTCHLCGCHVPLDLMHVMPDGYEICTGCSWRRASQRIAEREAINRETRRALYDQERRERDQATRVARLARPIEGCWPDGIQWREATPIARLPLSARSANCLMNAGIETVGELLRWTHAELLRFGNFGQTSLAEIIFVLTADHAALAVKFALSAQEQEVCRLRRQKLSYRVIGKKLGITSGRSRQLWERAMRKRHDNRLWRRLWRRVRQVTDDRPISECALDRLEARSTLVTPDGHGDMTVTYK